MKTTLTISTLLLCGCLSTGDAKFTTWGEEFIEEGIPLDTPELAGFVDGWTVKYNKFLVTYSELKVAHHDGQVGATMAGAKVFDLTKKGPFEVTVFSKLPATRWDEVSYAIAPVATSTAGNATAADVTLMHDKAYSIYFDATATKGTVTKHFAWGFSTNTLFEKCLQETFGAGVVVPPNGSETVELTLHGDHLYYDDLESPDAKIRFQEKADADANSDGEITMEELDAVNLTRFPVGRYGTGGAGNVKTLKDFVTALSRTVGHFRGEGECSPKAR